MTSIGERAFHGCSGLTSVTIPNSVTSIERRTFYGCSGLTSVTIPNSVTSIGKEAFFACSGLTSLTIPNSVTSIGEDAFVSVHHIEYYGNASGAPWGAIYMNGVIDGDYIYSSSSHDTLIGYIGSGGNVTIPNSVTCIGNLAFDNCSGLTSVTIPNSVTSIGDSVFSHCSGLTSVTIGNSVTSIGKLAFFRCSSLTSVTIPNSVTSIGKGAFCGCYGLTSMTIPEGVTTIDTSVFSSCSGLTHVSIPNSVTRIARYAFSYCYSLTSVTIPRNVAILEGFAFNECDSLTTVNYNATECLTDNNPVFTSCPNISTINIGENVTSIPNYLFSNFSGLTDVIIPDSVTTIGNFAFLGCVNLTSLIIGNSVTTIGRDAFNGCDSLKSATIGYSVNMIHYGAFAYCRSLSSITFKSPVPPAIQEPPANVYDGDVFYGVPSNIAVYIPCGTLALYMSRLPSTWNNYIENTFTFSAQSDDDSMGTVQVLNEPTCTNPNAVIYAVPATGFLFDHWSNGSTQNPYSLIVTTDTVITAFFVSEGEPEGIDDINNDNIRIYSVDGNIVVVGAEDETVRVFDMTGRLVGTQSLPSGIYMVKVGTLPTRKVVVTR